MYISIEIQVGYIGLYLRVHIKILEKKIEAPI